MANFSFSAVQPTALTNLNATATGLTVSFTWDAQGLDEKVEVWKSADTTQADAVLIAATWDHNFQESENAGGNTAYYWLRKVNTLQGGQNGPWSSMITVSVTGVTATVTTVSDGSITPSKLSSGFAAIDNSSGALKTGVVGLTNLGTTSVTPASISASNGGSTGSLSSSNTWQSFANCSFTAGNHIQYMMYMYLILQYGAFSGTNAVTVTARFRLHDNTVGADVPACTQTQMMYWSMSIGGQNTAYVNKTLAEVNIETASGFADLLISGHSYTLYGEVMTNNLSNMSVTIVTSGSSIAGASFS